MKNVNSSEFRINAEKMLKSVCGEDAGFREGQYEAIEATLTHHRTLVVQKTGWGKSMIYFITAKLSGGLTLVISPLLVLMDNQKEAAQKLGLKCAVLNAKVKGEQRSELIRGLCKGDYDILFTTPETLFSKDVSQSIPNLNISLFVIDECHCISDWGHDFRLEYGRLNRIIRLLPESVSILGTTATANSRVIDDLKQQLGEDVFVLRGPLTRESLHIEILRMKSKAERYAWIKKNMNKLPGSGIIYCLTKRDCDQLSEYLNINGLNTLPYHSGLTDELVKEAEDSFRENRIKALVATIKMGMGYDKNDIGFVIHFQKPGSLVAYYQQIGRAGRSKGMEAYCFLMIGKEDNEVSEYFIEQAFPKEDEERAIVTALENNDGMTEKELFTVCNISGKALGRSLMFLMNQGVITREYRNRWEYERTPNEYTFQGQHYDEVKRIKKKELEDLNAYAEIKECLSKYVVNRLDDNTACCCGKCSNCLGHSILEGIVLPTEDEVSVAQKYLGTMYIAIEPRKQWPNKENPFDSGAIKISNKNETGIALAKYGATGYGEWVSHDKYHTDSFRKELVEKSAELLKDRLREEGYTILTNIPSARNTKVSIFTRQLAETLGCTYLELLAVTGNGGQQKEMNNSYYQFNNAVEKLKLNPSVLVPNGASIVLVDDMVDSKWTLTIAGALILSAGAHKVFPFCLADSSNMESE